jgi:hypothetical protein
MDAVMTNQHNLTHPHNPLPSDAPADPAAKSHGHKRSTAPQD